ncbi:MAG: hypothetical protein ACOYJQ_10270 [Pseudochelatococcus sp.]|uniref:hypothetical protein n=1 Tax=Pseudochelatococcus sp. TaxID=2020869 RepID=UPI003D924FC6
MKNIRSLADPRIPDIDGGKEDARRHHIIVGQGKTTIVQKNDIFLYKRYFERILIVIDPAGA